MGFSCGIIGLPNVGKSTIFNALTRSSVPASNYPFCTIDPNVGVVAVPDPRLAQIAALAPSDRVTPTVIEFTDIAGLVKGASQGEGLGNQFLGHIAQVDAIAHVVRCFEDAQVVHVEGSIDPRRDIEVVKTELALRDLALVQGAVARTEKAAKSGEKPAMAALKVLELVQDALERGEPARSATQTLSPSEWEVVKPLNLLTTKPMFYVANVGEREVADGDAQAIRAVREIADAEGAPVVPICGAIESQIAGLERAEERQEYLAAVGLSEPGLHRLVRVGYDVLELITFFTISQKEDRAWTIRRGTTAVEAAGTIHSDMARGFIRAEVIGYEEFVRGGGDAGARAQGKLRLEGKDYIVRDGDLLKIRFST